MGARKRVQKIPSKVTLKCPKCGKNNRIDVPMDRLVNFLQCKHCKEISTTPLAGCCMICSFTKYRCPMNLLIEAKAKNLEIRMVDKAEKKDSSDNKMVFKREDFWKDDN